MACKRSSVRPRYSPPERIACSDPFFLPVTSLMIGNCCYTMHLSGHGNLWPPNNVAFQLPNLRNGSSRRQADLLLPIAKDFHLNPNSTKMNFRLWQGMIFYILFH